MNNLRKIIAVCFCILLVCITVQFVQFHNAKPEIVEVHDTLVKYHTDTIFHEKPKIVQQTVLKRDTVQVWSPHEHDSVQVELPYISKEYQDSTYRAWVSGFQDVNLDSIEVYQKTKTIEINNTKYVTKYKNRPFGFSIGIGGTYSPITNNIEPGVFLGITYTIKSF